MWSYYGSKQRMIKYYPPPVHDVIIEPFAGSAQYALRYWDRDVYLVDKSQVIINIWKYLRDASVKDIRDLPEIKVGRRIFRDDFSCEGEFNLMQFLIHQGAFCPGNIPTEFGVLRYASTKKKIIASLGKIRHWGFICGDYTIAGQNKATWFIDAPYVVGGTKYTHSSTKINFDHLAEWCRSREGQVIVCENTKANWLPFHPLVQINGINKTKSVEAMWSNLETESRRYKTIPLITEV